MKFGAARRTEREACEGDGRLSRRASPVGRDVERRCRSRELRRAHARLPMRHDSPGHERADRRSARSIQPSVVPCSSQAMRESAYSLSFAAFGCFSESLDAAAWLRPVRGRLRRST